MLEDGCEGRKARLNIRAPSMDAIFDCSLTTGQILAGTGSGTANRLPATYAAVPHHADKPAASAVAMQPITAAVWLVPDDPPSLMADIGWDPHRAAKVCRLNPARSRPFHAQEHGIQ